LLVEVLRFRLEFWLAFFLQKFFFNRLIAHMLLGAMYADTELSWVIYGYIVLSLRTAS